MKEERQVASERGARERRAMERQLLEARHGGREAERRRSVEEQLRDILTVVRSLNTMVLMLIRTSCDTRKEIHIFMFRT